MGRIIKKMFNTNISYCDTRAAGMRIIIIIIIAKPRCEEQTLVIYKTRQIADRHGQSRMIAKWRLLVVVACIWTLGHYVKPVDSSHFMGGLIHWRPVNPAAFDGTVRTFSVYLIISL